MNNVVAVLKNKNNSKSRELLSRLKQKNIDSIVINTDVFTQESKDELLEQLSIRDEEYVVFINEQYKYIPQLEQLLNNIGSNAVYDAVVFGTTKAKITADVGRNLLGIENIVFSKKVLFDNKQYDMFFDNIRGLVGFNLLKLHCENYKLGFIEKPIFSHDGLVIVEDRNTFDNENLIYNNFLKKNRLFQLRNYEKLRIHNAIYHYDIVKKRDERLKDINLEFIYKDDTQTFVAFFAKYEFAPKTHLFYVAVEKDGQVLDMMELKIFAEADYVTKVAKKRYSANNTFRQLTDGEEYEYILLGYNIVKMSFTELARAIGKHKEVK